VTEEPLDADAWVHTIESNFSLLVVPCSDVNKVRFAAQQLRGTARLWWDQYTAMLPADHIVTWDEFKNAFRAHHIPQGLMERRFNEFLDLTQGLTLFSNMPRNSIIYVSMWVIRLTLT